MPANAEVSMCRPAVLRQSAQIVRDDFQPCSQLIRNGARRHGVAAPPASRAGVRRCSTIDLWKM